MTRFVFETKTFDSNVLPIELPELRSGDTSEVFTLRENLQYLFGNGISSAT